MIVVLKMAGQTSPGLKSSPTYRICVSGCSRGDGGCSSAVRGIFPLCLCCPSTLCCTDSYHDSASPSWTVPDKQLLCTGVDVQIFKGHLEPALESIYLSPDCALALGQFTIQRLPI
ncbi:hypothetical protein ATANTOWER_007967 [Ataeniobius toweri]|uniref:Uncharacterized protein n=1 Tax=Ataeniobius toweri TaxID=208326 RepID=A0ABU7AE75_9TELE|nr:hypothetical protein [Ataeniobius toweri]